MGIRKVQRRRKARGRNRGEIREEIKALANKFDSILGVGFSILYFLYHFEYHTRILLIPICLLYYSALFLYNLSCKFMTFARKLILVLK